MPRIATVSKSKPYLIHGTPSKFGGCDNRPTCSECETGMLCDNDSGDHFCGFHLCPTFDSARMDAYRTRMNAYRMGSK